VAEEGTGRQGVTVESIKRRKRRSSRFKNRELFPTGGETNLLCTSVAFQSLAFSQVDPKAPWLFLTACTRHALLSVCHHYIYSYMDVKTVTPRPWNEVRA